MNNMSLDEKIGQLILGQLKGNELNKEMKEFIMKYRLGGYRFSGENIENLPQVTKFISDVKRFCEENSIKEPIFGADQEGGTLSVFENLLSQFPSTMALGATTDVKLAYDEGNVIGYELSNLGIDMAFAPVADLNLQKNNPVIGVRSFGDNPEKVSKFCIKFAKGLNDGGVLNSAKHFPGHGNTTADSHIGLAENSFSEKEIRDIEIKPFIKLIENGIDTIMVSHVIYKNIEKNKIPASMSKIIITDILRNELKYNGVIISDDMEMGAILKKYPIEEAVVKFLLAGGDMALVNGTKEAQIKAVEGIKEAVKLGIISEERINQSVERILKLKSKAKKLKINKKSPRKKTEEVIKDISEKALTLYSDNKKLLPIKKNLKLLLLLPESINMTEADTSGNKINKFGVYLKEKIKNVDIITYKLNENLLGDSDILKKIEKSDILIQGILNGMRFKNQIEFINNISSKIDTIAITLRDPYELKLFSKDITAIAAYSQDDITMKSLAKAITEKFEFNFILPVKI
ncbi:beta-N-acetylhexosaminidase [Haliovirga abyssi]|uniref:Beta-glucosidase n=1 Tax=Haliovirga abyssi TaxID=2996794 RepID=A0AAU9DAH8_9FUSO|nr:beta-N-acetylhexosaminidase [Haliovirga abyssi]BDU51648.1 beta-glucosidase [Haliovirga abyssi]